MTEPASRRRRQRKRKHNPHMKYEKQPVKGLIPNLKFVEKYSLHAKSHPADWFRAFIPNSSNKGDYESVCTQRWCTYTNMKAEMDCSNEKEEILQPFTAKEIEQQLSLFIFQGLSPSPQLAMKAKFISEEMVQGNDHIAQVMGKNFDRRHRQFKSYFAVQHPHMPIPSKDTHPNWKVDPFLKHVNQVSMQAMVLPEYISADEQTIGFHGASEFKSRITFKKTGDGFQADSLCSNGYTFTFYFRHQKAPQIYIDKGLSPLHSRIMFMFDQLKNKHHSVFMDNLYMSASFARAALLSKNKVKIHGVTRGDKKGIPDCVKQIELKNEKMVLEVKNTVKVAVLEGDNTCKDLVAISYYDSKPVYFLSTVVKDIEWETVTKKVFSKQLQKKLTCPFCVLILFICTTTT